VLTLTSEELALMQNASEADQPGLVAAKWMQGYKIEWAIFYEAQKPNKISLPTYPFQGESYWAGVKGAIPLTINGSGETPANKMEKNHSKSSEYSAPRAIPVKEATRSAISVPETEIANAENPATGLQRDEIANYLKEICCDLLKIPVQKMSDNKPFSVYGIDSILVREITGIMEKKLGALPKTLFFQCANINELTDYLVKNHSPQLEKTFRSRSSTVTTSAVIARPTDQVADKDFFISKSQLTADHKAVMIKIGGIHAKGFYLLDIWTHVYISDQNDYYFHILREGNNLYVTWYGGEQENEAKAVAKMQSISKQLDCKMIYWSRGNTAFPGFTSAAIAVFQTIENIGHFSLEGSKMKKLRYMVNKFIKEGEVAVKEYQQIDESTDDEIRAVILKWTENKQFVNSVDHAIKEVNDGSWKERYRLFLTYLDGVLQSVIFINKLPIGMYLLDQEYYLPDMPLGSTEYSMIEIMKQLSSEGEDSFSFGLTWKILEDQNDGDDEAGTAFLSELRKKETVLGQIYHRGSKNFQYKMKFLPANKSCYLHRPADSDPESIIEFLSLFIRRGVSHEEVRELICKERNAAGKPSVKYDAEQLDSKVLITQQPEQKVTASAEEEHDFFDVTTVPKDQVAIDMMSDSWMYFKNQMVRERMSTLSQRVEENYQYDTLIKEVLGLAHLHIAPMGRSAEKLFFAAAARNKGIIASNLLFYTTIHHLSEKGFRLIECPDPAVSVSDSQELFRGGIDLPALSRAIDENPGEVRMILIELCNNASGGYPVAMKHLKEVQKVAEANSITLTFDITRIVKNALMIIEHEEGYGSYDVWEVIREICSLPHHVIGSLSKDFCVSKGGIVGSKSAVLIAEAG
ncbi:MAG: beta-eliminating lyase-related protein, partial [Cyclobacteriaceae bacterium]